MEEKSREGMTGMVCWVAKEKKCEQQAYDVFEGEGDRSVGTDPEQE